MSAGPGVVPKKEVPRSVSIDALVAVDSILAGRILGMSPRGQENWLCFTLKRKPCPYAAASRISVWGTGRQGICRHLSRGRAAMHIGVRW